MSRKRTGVCIPQNVDGIDYQYGVRFVDGSIAHGWNGRTQLDRCQERIFIHAKVFNGERLTLVRRRVHPWECRFEGGWEHVDIDPWRKPLTNYVRVNKPWFPRALFFWRGHATASYVCRAAERVRRRMTSIGDHQ